MKPTEEQSELTNSSQIQYCFYGAGSMAEAIVRGMLSNEIVTPDQIRMLNRSDNQRLDYLRDRYQVAASNDAEVTTSWLEEAEVIVLLMKPKDALEACRQLKPLLRPDALIISAIAGLSIDAIQQMLGSVAVVRTMPNTSCTIGLGATGLCYSSEVSENQLQLALRMFEATGIVTIVDESLMDTVTGISGSGPAYVYYFMEAMIEAGITQGLEPEQAQALVVQTVLGAAEMVRRTGEAPADLRRKVTSPGGTTQAALNVLNEYHTRETIQSAIASASDRAAEMGAQIIKEII